MILMKCGMTCGYNFILYLPSNFVEMWAAVSHYKATIQWLSVLIRKRGIISVTTVS